MTARSAHLPESLVRCLPNGREKIHQRFLKRPARFVRFQSNSAGEVKRVDHFADDVQLKLIGSRVSDPNRPGVFVSWQPRQFELGQTPLAHDAIDRVYLRWFSGSGAEHPVAPRFGLFSVTAGRQGIECKRRVTQPTESVIPIAHAAELLRNRSRNCGDDAAGRCIGECFECNQGAYHFFPPFSSISAALRPLETPIGGAADFLRGISLRRRGVVRREPSQREGNALSGRNRKISHCTKIFPAKLNRRSKAKRVWSTNGNQA